MKARIVFFGSTEFSAKVLEGLNKQVEVLKVITRADKPAGRTGKLNQTPVSAIAGSLGLNTSKPININDPAFFKELRELDADLFIVVAYGKIIPQNILDLPKHGAINIHPSLLPKYRGPSPIKTALLNGDTWTGVSIMLMDAEMDHGPILAEQPAAIDPNENDQQLLFKLALIGEELIIKVIPEYLQGKIKPQNQEHSKATYTKMVKKEDGKINWGSSAQQIYNQYRAFYNWPGIWTTWKNQTLKITGCLPGLAEQNLKPGTVFQAADKKVLICCKNGALEILELQLAGKKPTAAKDFINGHRDFIGSILLN